ncbi:MAG: type II toxin-antitoxin system VapC family toxin [Dehalococcoidia bacterium]
MPHLAMSASLLRSLCEGNRSSWPNDRLVGLKARIFDRFGPQERAKRRRLTAERLGYSDNDIWIAATVLHGGLIVVSADSDFRRMQEVTDLTIENWWPSLSTRKVPDQGL